MTGVVPTLLIIIIADIDECRVPDSCNAITEDCSNTMGGFNCICKTGFSLINNSICEGKGVITVTFMAVTICGAEFLCKIILWCHTYV